MYLRDYYDYFENRSRALKQLIPIRVQGRIIPKNQRLIDDYNISEEEVLDAQQRHKIDLFEHILARAQCGTDWRQSEANYIDLYGLDEGEIETYIKENWSQAVELKERKKLIRILALSHLFMTDWKTEHAYKIERLNVTVESVVNLAERLGASEYGRQMIKKCIVRGGMTSSSNWREAHEELMRIHRINPSDVESEIIQQRELEQQTSERSRLIRETRSKDKLIMSGLDVAEHPDFSADELMAAREKAIQPEYRQVLFDVLVKKLIEGTKFGLNYITFMRIHGISLESILEAARQSVIFSAISKVNVDKPKFSEESVRRWNQVLAEVDSPFKSTYEVTINDLEEALRSTLRHMLLRDLCLHRPDNKSWRDKYEVPIKIAGFGFSEMEEYLGLTKNLDESGIEALFNDALNHPELKRFSCKNTKVIMADIELLKSKFRKLWRLNYRHLGDIHFNIHIGPLSKLRIGEIRGADLLDSDPSFASHQLLTDALTKIADEVAATQPLYAWSTESSSAGCDLEIFDG